MVVMALTCTSANLVVERSGADARPGRYLVKAGTVYDTKTKLTWQEGIAPSPFSLVDATSYCKGLDLNVLAWRLPSVKELETLVDESRVNPSIDHVAFPDTPGKFFWTSSVVANFPSNGWTVDFNRGGDNYFPLTSSQLVRCVH